MAQSLKFSNGGFSARVSRSAEFNEWRVSFYRADGSKLRMSDYYTEDKTDAIGTAQTVIAQLMVDNRV